jgi:hypothetical protein
MHALRFPSDIPDHLARLLEIDENLQREELTTEEKAAHIMMRAAVMKQAGIIEKDTYGEGNF